MKKKNFNISEESNDLFEQIYERLINETPGINQGEAFAKIMQGYENKNDEVNNQSTEMVDQLLAERISFVESLGFLADTSLENVARTILAQDKRHTSLLEELTSIKEELTSTKEALRKSEQERMQFDGITGEELQEVNRKHQEDIGRLQEAVKIRENQIIITLHTPAKEILEESCKRLSTLFNREVTPADLLLDVFVRYSIEQYNEWFFPFVIKPYEMKQLTGYTAEELKAWLRGEPKKEA